MSYQCLYSTLNINGFPELCRNAEDFIAVVRESMGNEPASMVSDIVDERQEMEDELEELKKDLISALAGIEDIYSAIDEEIEKKDFVKIEKLIDSLKEKTDEAGNLA